MNIWQRCLIKIVSVFASSKAPSLSSTARSPTIGDVQSDLVKRILDRYYSGGKSKVPVLDTWVLLPLPSPPPSPEARPPLSTGLLPSLPAPPSHRRTTRRTHSRALRPHGSDHSSPLLPSSTAQPTSTILSNVSSGLARAKPPPSLGRMASPSHPLSRAVHARPDHVKQTSKLSTSSTTSLPRPAPSSSPKCAWTPPSLSKSTFPTGSIGRSFLFTNSVKVAHWKLWNGDDHRLPAPSTSARLPSVPRLPSPKRRLRGSTLSSATTASGSRAFILTPWRHPWTSLSSLLAGEVERSVIFSSCANRSSQAITFADFPQTFETLEVVEELRYAVDIRLKPTPFQSRNGPSRMTIPGHCFPEQAQLLQGRRGSSTPRAHLSSSCLGKSSLSFASIPHVSRSLLTLPIRESPWSWYGHRYRLPGTASMPDLAVIERRPPNWAPRCNPSTVRVNLLRYRALCLTMFDQGVVDDRVLFKH